MTTGVLIQVSTEGLDHGGIILAERRAMGCDRAAVAQARRQTAGGRSPGSEWHPASLSRGLAVARTSGGLWAADHGVQPVQPLEPAWPLAGDLRGPCRLRGSPAHRHGGQHLGSGTSRGRGR